MTLQPFVSDQFNGEIWRMEIDGISGTMFVESRRNDDKQVFFSSINVQTGKINFKNLTSPERWLTGIEAAFNGVLLVHFYQAENAPVHKGLLAIDAVTGETLWNNFNYAFDHLSVNGPVIYDSRLQPRKLFLADIKTGATTRIFEPSVYKELLTDVAIPEVITPEELPVKLLSIHPFGNTVHYLEYNNFRIVSLHALKGGVLTQLLYVFDDVTRVYEEIINADIQKIQPEAFMLHHNRLIYIKNKTELRVISL